VLLEVYDNLTAKCCGGWLDEKMKGCILAVWLLELAVLWVCSTEREVFVHPSFAVSTAGVVWFP
jgi:hypothetical protein